MFESTMNETKQFWANLSVRDRRIVMGLCAVILVMILLFMYMVVREDSYSKQIPVAEDRTMDAMQALQTKGIDARSPSPGIIAVKEKEWRHAVSALTRVMRLPPQIKGDEQWEGSPLGRTKAVLDRQLQLGLQIDLERTIMINPNIRRADVKIREANRRLLKDQSTEAAVTITVDAKEPLSSRSVTGLVNMALAFVPGLEPSNVVVVDQNFNVLNEVISGNPGDRIRMKQQEAEAIVKLRMESAALSHIEPFLGRGKAMVTADAVLVFKDTQTEKKEYGEDPHTTTKETREHTSTNAIPDGGQPGPNSNIQDTNVTTGAGTGMSSNDSEEEVKLENVFSCTDTVEKQYVRDIISKTLAVTCDTTAVRVMAAGMIGETTLPSVTSTHFLNALDTLEQQLKTSINFNEVRGDLVTVRHLPLDTSEEAELLRIEETRRRAEMIRTYSYLAGVLIILLMVAIGAVVLRRRKMVEITAPIEEMEERMEEPASRELSLYELGIRDMSDISALPAEEQRRVLLRREVEEFALKRQEEAAQIIKNWLSE
jgi:flagellar M-ring protein FliF